MEDEDLLKAELGKKMGDQELKVAIDKLNAKIEHLELVKTGVPCPICEERFQSEHNMLLHAISKHAEEVQVGRRKRRSFSLGGRKLLPELDLFTAGIVLLVVVLFCLLLFGAMT